MNPAIPFFISVFFMATTLATVYLVARLDEKRSLIAWTLVAWLLIQGAVTMTGFYLATDTIPPRFALLIGPPVLLIVLLLILPASRTYLLSLSPEKLTWIHTVRVPVEIALYWLYMAGQIPEVMTFEGSNYDIFSGLTAPLIVYFGFRKRILSRGTLIMWNLLCLLLLANIVTHAILAAPTPFQQIAFDQPNRGVFYFPFSWLPGFIVPAVLFAHVTSLLQLISQDHK
jgi:hypothetical protein